MRINKYLCRGVILNVVDNRNSECIYYYNLRIYGTGHTKSTCTTTAGHGLHIIDMTTKNTPPHTHSTLRHIFTHTQSYGPIHNRPYLKSPSHREWTEYGQSTGQGIEM